jgi:benzoyl-CoA reductase subunit C
MDQSEEFIQKFRAVMEDPHAYAKAWKARTNGKVIGWFCSYSPVEIIYAAGMLPVRVLGGNEPERLSDVYMFGKCCPFSRNCLAQGLTGKYDYLDGIVHARSCDAIEMAFHNWCRFLSTPFKYFILMPGHIDSPRALPLLKAEYRDFKDALGKLNNKAVSEEDLKRSVQEFNRNRALMKQMYGLMKADAPPLTGAEALEISLAGQVMDVKEHSDLLEQLLKVLPERKIGRDPGARLMLAGSVNDNVSFVKLVEDCGATCVIEENCCSTKYYWDEIASGRDVIEAIAQRYINRWPCPAFDWKVTGEKRGRWQRLWSCGPHSADLPTIKGLFESHNIPVLVLELDVTVPVGQFRTRIEAFLETFSLELV